MASTKEIKNHINAVRDTQKITNSMYLISSTKVRRAKAELENTRPYFAALSKEMRQIFRAKEDTNSRYFFPREGKDALDKGSACLVITADKGLAGAYNLNVLKKAEELLKTEKDIRLYVVGEYGRRYFHEKGIPVIQSFLYTAQNPTMHRAREISGVLLGEYARKEIDKIYLIFTDMKNGMVEEAICSRILPLNRQAVISEATESELREEAPQVEYFPSATAVLDRIVENDFVGFVYSALVDSFCSEQNARMTAMDAANQNAQSLLDELSLEYNRVRQSAITQEITEVSSGVMAMKKNKSRNEREFF